PAAPGNADPAAALFGESLSEREALLLELAALAAATDPARAARMARGSLANGVNPPLAATLLNIRASNQKLADELFRQAMAAAQRQSAPPGIAIMMLAPYVFPQ